LSTFFVVPSLQSWSDQAN